MLDQIAEEVASPEDTAFEEGKRNSGKRRVGLAMVPHPTVGTARSVFGASGLLTRCVRSMVITDRSRNIR